LFQQDIKKINKRNGSWGKGPIDYRNRLDEYKKEGNMRGFEITV
jgi:hypothetical protein